MVSFGDYSPFRMLLRVESQVPDDVNTSLQYCGSCTDYREEGRMGREGGREGTDDGEGRKEGKGEEGMTGHPRFQNMDAPMIQGVTQGPSHSMRHLPRIARVCFQNSAGRQRLTGGIIGSGMPPAG